VKSFRELFEIELYYAYDCEQKLVVKGLPAMIEAASSPQLQTALKQHVEVTRNHVRRLEQVFGNIGTDPETKDNDVLDELMNAAEVSVSNIDKSPLREAALIVNGNMVEHYEIATYGTLAAIARNLGLQKVVSPLEQTLEEEKKADAKLTKLGESMNQVAAKRQTA
jgi:ferritin-like metal-binding protein YciE